MVSDEDFYPAATLPAPLSIVWGRFPYEVEPGVTKTDINPCLVLGWDQLPVPGNRFVVLVVFGTSQSGRVEPWCNFQVSNASNMLIAGLNKVTYFDLGRWRRMLWHKAWFITPDPDKWPTPVVGRIGPDSAAVLRYQLQLREEHGMPVPPRPKPMLVANNPQIEG